jgi:hypothetical protein
VLHAWGADPTGPRAQEGEDERIQQQADLIRLSRNGKQVIAKRSGHHIHIDEANPSRRRHSGRAGASTKMNTVRLPIAETSSNPFMHTPVNRHLRQLGDHHPRRLSFFR